ncbi:MAG TPA: alginate lyase family protein [Negativicutes bacterium]|nr:alginate lyase family protein [Negativicutes bacterium]
MRPAEGKIAVVAGARRGIGQAIAAVVIAVMAAVWSYPAAVSWAGPPEGRFIASDEPGLDSVRDKARSRGAEKKLVINLGYDGDWYMKKPVMSVADKTVAPKGGTVHDYASLSRYFWPDPDKHDGLPYIVKDGLTNPEREDLHRYDALRLEKMADTVYSLSAVYYVTGQEKFAQRAALWLRTWFINPESRMNPSLDFAQGVPGKVAGTSFGIIETADLIRVVDAALMLESYPGWTVVDKLCLRQWFADYLRWLTDSPLGIKEKAAGNNHGVWYDAQVAAFAYYIGDYDQVKNVLSESVPQRIREQIRPDGEMPLEMARTRSLHYVIYNLQAFITLARLGDKVGINLWDYETTDGRGIRKAIDYVAPYISGEKKWPGQMLVPEREAGAAVYFAMAERHYRMPQYRQIALKLLGRTIGLRELAAKSLLSK